MRTGKGNRLIVWLTTALSVVAFVAGFNITVDPFGYFGLNRIGYYFSSERQFKHSLVNGFDYNAILLGDSRIAFTDTAQISQSEHTFVNGGIGGASIAELVRLLSASKLDRLKLAVLGVRYGDLQNCAEDGQPKAITWAGSSFWDGVRFAASWSQLSYALEAFGARFQGHSPKYHRDGTRSAAAKHLQEAGLNAKTNRYWRKIKENLPEEPRAAPDYQLGTKCRALLRQAQWLADRHGFDLLVVFLPYNSDLLGSLDLHTPRALKESRRFIAQVGNMVPHVVDLTRSAFSDSRHFWLDDSLHFKPTIGARIIREAISQSVARRQPSAS